MIAGVCLVFARGTANALAPAGRHPAPLASSSEQNHCFPLDTVMTVPSYQRPADAVGVRRALVRLPVRKPNRQEFVQVHRAPEYQMQIAILELKTEAEIYAVFPEVARAIPRETRSVTRKLMRGARLHQASYKRDEARRRKRSSYFLKGPLPFLWIRENIPDPASRVILVARAFMDMENTNAYPLTRKVWDCAGVEGKDRRRRILDKICRSTLGYTVITRPGRPSILRQASPASAP